MAGWSHALVAPALFPVCANSHHHLAVDAMYAVELSNMSIIIDDYVRSRTKNCDLLDVRHDLLHVVHCRVDVRCATVCN